MLCVTVLLRMIVASVTILCIVYDHPELGMIDYHPGMWMVYLNLHFVCESFTEDDCGFCNHTLYGI